MHPAGPDALIAGIARRQVGVIGREQLLRLGIGVEAIRYRVGAGRLHPVFPGAYAVGVPAASVEAIRIAALISTAPSFIGHRDAAEHYGLQDPIPGPVHVIVSHRRRLRRDGIVVHRTRHLHAEERRIVGPLRLATPARTLVDIAGACTDRQLTRAFDESQRLGLASRMEILVACERAGSRPGTGRLAALAREPAMPVDRARNRNEAEFPRFCRDRGLPIPAVNVPLLGYEVDYLWVEQGVVGELDSGHHDSPRAREADVRRDADLRAYGYPVIRMRQRDLRSGAERLAARLRRLLLSDPA